MIKHLNFTGRRRIPRSRVQIEVHDGQPRTFDAVIDLSGARLPPPAKVYLEAMCAGVAAVQRFPFGTVDRIVAPTRRALDELQGENVFFSLKVVDCTERMGRILGIAENIRPHRGGKQTATGRRGILPIDYADLGQRIWDLKFGEHDVFLLVNREIPGLKERARWDPMFYSLVYPAVVRQVLVRACEANCEIDEGDDRWPVLWLRFGKHLHSQRLDPPGASAVEEERDEWIDDVVSAFCEAHGMKDQFLRGILQANGGEM